MRSDSKGNSFVYKTKSGNNDNTAGKAITKADMEIIKNAKGKRELLRILINTVRYAAGLPSLPPQQKQ